MTKESINLSLLGWSLVIILAGSLIIISVDDWGLPETWQILVSQILSIIVITTALNFLWEQYSKEKFKKEILGAKSFSDEIERAGLTQIPSDQGFQEEINWEKYFDEVRNLDLFVSYAYSWRQNNRNRLKRFAKKENTRANIILPDYEDDKIVDQLALWFGKDSEEIKESIEESAEDFYRLFNGKEIDFHIYLTSTTPVYSFYRFDHIGILALYKHRKEKSGVPSFVMEEGGSLYNFISEDFKYLKENSKEYKNED